jgi:hypothetical protein
MDYLTNRGSVDDIRCTLRLMNPVKPSEIRNEIDWLNISLAYEIRTENRITLVRMIKAKINKLKRLI